MIIIFLIILFYAVNVQLLVGGSSIGVYDYLYSFLLAMYQSINGTMTSGSFYVGIVYETVDYVSQKIGAVKLLFVYFSRFKQVNIKLVLHNIRSDNKIRSAESPHSEPVPDVAGAAGEG